jgi:hypothetical protein
MAGGPVPPAVFCCRLAMPLCNNVATVHMLRRFGVVEAENNYRDSVISH